MGENKIDFKDETERYCYTYFSQLRLVALIRTKYKLQKKIRTLRPCITQEITDAYKRLFEEMDRVSAIEAKLLSKTVQLK